jgi:hypothetical protein
MQTLKTSSLPDAHYPLSVKPFEKQGGGAYVSALTPNAYAFPAATSWTTDCAPYAPLTALTTIRHRGWHAGGSGWRCTIRRVSSEAASPLVLV